MPDFQGSLPAQISDYGHLRRTSYLSASFPDISDMDFDMHARMCTNAGPRDVMQLYICAQTNPIASRNHSKIIAFVSTTIVKFLSLFSTHLSCASTSQKALYFCTIWIFTSHYWYRIDWQKCTFADRVLSFFCQINIYAKLCFQEFGH